MRQKRQFLIDYRETDTPLVPYTPVHLMSLSAIDRTAFFIHQASVYSQESYSSIAWERLSNRSGLTPQQAVAALIDIHGLEGLKQPPMTWQIPFVLDLAQYFFKSPDEPALYSWQDVLKPPLSLPISSVFLPHILKTGMTPIELQTATFDHRGEVASVLGQALRDKQLLTLSMESGFVEDLFLFAPELRDQESLVQFFQDLTPEKEDRILKLLADDQYIWGCDKSLAEHLFSTHTLEEVANNLKQLIADKAPEMTRVLMKDHNFEPSRYDHESARFMVHLIINLSDYAARCPFIGKLSTDPDILDYALDHPLGWRFFIRVNESTLYDNKLTSIGWAYIRNWPDQLNRVPVFNRLYQQGRLLHRVSETINSALATVIDVLEKEPFAALSLTVDDLSMIPPLAPALVRGIESMDEAKLRRFIELVDDSFWAIESFTTACLQRAHSLNITLTLTGTDASDPVQDHVLFNGHVTTTLKTDEIIRNPNRFTALGSAVWIASQLDKRLEAFSFWPLMLTLQAQFKANKISTALYRRQARYLCNAATDSAVHSMRGVIVEKFRDFKCLSPATVRQMVEDSAQLNRVLLDSAKPGAENFQWKGVDRLIDICEQKRKFITPFTAEAVMRHKAISVYHTLHLCPQLRDNPLVLSFIRTVGEFELCWPLMSERVKDFATGTDEKLAFVKRLPATLPQFCAEERGSFGFTRNAMIGLCETYRKFGEKAANRAFGKCRHALQPLAVNQVMQNRTIHQSLRMQGLDAALWIYSVMSFDGKDAVTINAIAAHLMEHSEQFGQNLNFWLNKYISLCNILKAEAEHIPAYCLDTLFIGIEEYAFLSLAGAITATYQAEIKEAFSYPNEQWVAQCLEADTLHAAAQRGLLILWQQETSIINTLTQQLATFCRSMAKATGRARTLFKTNLIENSAESGLVLTVLSDLLEALRTHSDSYDSITLYLNRMVLVQCLRAINSIPSSKWIMGANTITLNIEDGSKGVSHFFHGLSGENLTGNVEGIYRYGRDDTYYLLNTTGGTGTFWQPPVLDGGVAYTFCRKVIVDTYRNEQARANRTATRLILTTGDSVALLKDTFSDIATSYLLMEKAGLLARDVFKINRLIADGKGAPNDVSRSALNKLKGNADMSAPDFLPKDLVDFKAIQNGPIEDALRWEKGSNGDLGYAILRLAPFIGDPALRGLIISYGMLLILSCKERRHAGFYGDHVFSQQEAILRLYKNADEQSLSQRWRSYIDFVCDPTVLIHAPFVEMDTICGNFSKQITVIRMRKTPGKQRCRTELLLVAAQKLMRGESLDISEGQPGISDEAVALLWYSGCHIPRKCVSCMKCAPDYATLKLMHLIKDRQRVLDPIIQAGVFGRYLLPDEIENYWHSNKKPVPRLLRWLTPEELGACADRLRGQQV